MSLDTAKDWARYALQSPAAQQDVVRLFERAAADGVEALQRARSALFKDINRRSNQAA